MGGLSLQFSKVTSEVEKNSLLCPRKLLMEFKHIQKQYWGRHFWAWGYFVASSGNVTDEAIAEYIRGQDGTEPSDGDDKFQVIPS